MEITKKDTTLIGSIKHFFNYYGITCYFFGHLWGEPKKGTSERNYCDCKRCPSWKDDKNHVTITMSEHELQVRIFVLLLVFIIMVGVLYSVLCMFD